MSYPWALKGSCEGGFAQMKEVRALSSRRSSVSDRGRAFLKIKGSYPAGDLLQALRTGIGLWFVTVVRHANNVGVTSFGKTGQVSLALP